MKGTFKLRDYQESAIKGLRRNIKDGDKNLVLCLPTGSGKTVVFSYMVLNHIAKGGKALILTHRTELLKQANLGLKDAEIIDAGSKPDLTKPLHIGMVETLYRRMDNYKSFIESRTLIIIDEAHLAHFDKIFPYIENHTIVIGATATPYRKGNAATSLTEFYDSMVQEIDTPELIEMGFLAPAKTYGVEIDLSEANKKGDDYDTSHFYEKNKTYKGVVDNYKQIAPNKKTILFASNIKSSKQVAGEFNINGFKARHIDGDTPKNERKEILEWFDNTPDAILCNCGILTAGFDQPDIETVILYRATTSLPLFLQMCGRGSRLAPNKTHFNILDFGNNIQRLGFWEDARTWTLEKDKKKSSKIGATMIKICGCGAINYHSAVKCECCEKPFKKSKKEKEEDRIAELKLLSKREILSYAALSDVEEKAKLAKAKLVKASWVLHSMTDINEARYFIKLMNYSHGYEFQNKQRFAVFRK